MTTTRILFLGNSITRHAPKADIGWHGDWGMAASAPEKDFAHILTQRVAAALGGAEPMFVNIADYERTYDTCDLAAYFKPYVEFKPDIVVMAIGENVPPLDTAEKCEAYRKSFAALLDLFREVPDRRIFVRGVFADDKAKDNAMKAAATAAGIHFQEIGHLALDPANQAGSERTIENAGVAWHPGDRGMQAIAHALFLPITESYRLTRPQPIRPDVARWELGGTAGIRWDVAADRHIPHYDYTEMSGRQASLFVFYGVDANRAPVLLRDMIWPRLRMVPNEVIGSFIRHNIPGTLEFRMNGCTLPLTVQEIHFDGMLTFRSRSMDGLEVERVIFPSVDQAGSCERWTIRNLSAQSITLNVQGPDVVEETPPAVGFYGSYHLEFKTHGLPGGTHEGSITLAPAGSHTLGLTFTARRMDEPPVLLNVEAEESKRRALIAGLQGALRLESPDPVLNREFDLCKLRTSESIFDTKNGLTHSPGCYPFYAAIWANDQAEYTAPFFPFTGYDIGNEAGVNTYRWFAKYMNPEFRRLPTAIIAEATDTWNLTGQHPGDRGDAAMVAYGAARFALASGSADTARELWPLIQWCLEYCRRQLTPEGVVASDSDELEGRFPTGKANLCTSSLTYDALRSAAHLARELGESQRLAEDYTQQADALHGAIERYFGGRMEGFDAYRYYDGNTTLRAWICIPLTMGILDRAKATTDALFSPTLWTEDGLATEAGQLTFWDRATLYGLRGVLAAGDVERGMEFLQRYSRRRLLSDHVPYPFEAYPEGGKRHMAAESALYCRVITEGLFGTRPTGLRSFTCSPRLPRGWERMALRDIKAFGHTFDIEAARRGSDETVRVLCAGRTLLETALDPQRPVAVRLPE